MDSQQQPDADLKIIKHLKTEEQQAVPAQIVQIMEPPKPQIDPQILEAQAKLFAQIAAAPKIKKKKKSKTQKKYEEIQKMLETSNKFFSVVKKPNCQNAENLQQVLNSTKVLMEPAGVCSIDGATKKYKNWPDYCKTHKFISSLNGALPDMILPSYFTTEFSGVTDAIMNMKKGKEYRMRDGMKKMSQTKAVYPKNEDENSESEFEDEQTPDVRNEADAEMAGHESGGETMDEEDGSKPQFDKLFNVSQSAGAFSKPVVFDGRKKKDKSIKCRKCFKGGHEDVHCPI